MPIELTTHAHKRSGHLTCFLVRHSCRCRDNGGQTFVYIDYRYGSVLFSMASQYGKCDTADLMGYYLASIHQNEPPVSKLLRTTL